MGTRTNSTQNTPPPSQNDASFPTTQLAHHSNFTGALQRHHLRTCSMLGFRIWQFWETILGFSTLQLVSSYRFSFFMAFQIQLIWETQCHKPSPSHHHSYRWDNHYILTLPSHGSFVAFQAARCSGRCRDSTIGPSVP